MDVTRISPVLLLLASCGSRPPTAQDCKALSTPQAIAERCFGGNIQTGKYVGDLNCWPFSKPHKIKGVWLVALEASEFYPDARALNETRGRSPGNWTPQVWLQTRLLNNRPELRAAGQGAGPRVYAVEFVGQQSLCGAFGHFGIYPKEVIVDRFVMMRPLSAP